MAKDKLHLNVAQSYLPPRIMLLTGVIKSDDAW
jgi:hypothetical protein